MRLLIALTLILTFPYLILFIFKILMAVIVMRIFIGEL